MLIQHRDVELLGGKRCDGPTTVLDERRVMAEFDHHSPHEFPKQRIIIGHENPPSLRAPWRLAWRHRLASRARVAQRTN